MPQLHTIVNALRDQFGARLFDATGGGGRVQLLTDGRDVYARTDRGDFFNLLKTPTQPLLVVGNEGLLKELRSSLRPRRRRRRTGRKGGEEASGSGRSARGRQRAAE
jgi:hypothetical protein